jgi:hypothetical protein
VSRAVAALPQDQRLAVTLFYMDGLSCSDVAGFLGVSTDAVKVRLHRVRQRLREEVMAMIEGTLKAERPGQELARSVQVAVPCRVAEPFALSAPVSSRDTVLVYTDTARVRVRGGLGASLEVTGRKVLLGANEAAARERSRELVVRAERRVGVWATGPHQGQRFAGVASTQDGYVPMYESATGEWAQFRASVEQGCSFAAGLREMLSGEVLAVVAAGDRLAPIRVPFPLTGEGAEAFSAGYTVGSEGWALGAAGGVVLEVVVPACAHVVVCGARSLGLELDGLVGDVVVCGTADVFRARDIQGDLYALAAAPLSLQGLRGSLRIEDDCVHPGGGEWSETRIRRVGDVPTSRIRSVSGNLDARCRRLHLEVQGVAGNIHIANDFGRTRLTLDRTWPTGREAEVRSVAGAVVLSLPQELDERRTVALYTECGSIDRKGWPLGRCGYSDPAGIYLGNCPREERAQIRASSRCGTVRIRRRG